MKTKTHKVSVDFGDSEGPSTYSIKIEENKTSMFYSRFDCKWTSKFRGKKCASIVSTENGFEVKFKKKIINLNYSEACELQTLLDEVHRQGKFKRRTVRWDKK